MTKIKKQTRISRKDKADLAFEYYYTLGPDRNFDKVAEQFQVSLSTIKNYSMKYNWKERKLQRDIEIQKQMQEKTNTQVVDIKAKYRNDVNVAMAPLKHELNQIIIKLKNKEKLGWVKSFEDFERLTRCLERLAKLDLLLLGEATDKQEHEISTPKTFIDWLVDADRRRNSGSN